MYSSNSLWLTLICFPKNDITKRKIGLKQEKWYIKNMQLELVDKGDERNDWGDSTAKTNHSLTR